MMQEKAILVVDDENQMRLTLSLILQRQNYQVEMAANGKEALAHLEKRSFDLIFLDLNMPEMGGVELLVEIHQLYPNLPALVLTAHATLETAIQAVRHGARDYLIKPVNPNYILVRVADVLEESEQPDRKREIVSQVQMLLSELQDIEGPDATPTSSLAALPPTDDKRFLQKGPFSLDLHARHATLNDEYISITGIYFDYLVTLLRHAPKPVPYKSLVQKAQGFAVTLAEAKDLARWRIHELRKAIEPDPKHPQYILTIRSEGYRIEI